MNVRQFIFLVYDRTVLNFYRFLVLKSYYKRNFKDFHRYLSKIEPFDPGFVQFCQLFLRQFLKTDVTIEEWKRWVDQFGSSHIHILGRAIMELVTKYLHAENYKDAMEWFKFKCSKVGFDSSDVNACTGILNLFLKNGEHQRAEAFRVYLLDQIHDKPFDESAKLKFMEVFFRLDNVPEPRSKKAFENFEETKLFRKNKPYFEDLKNTYELIERQHPLLMDIRTSSEERKRLVNHIMDKIINKIPFQMIRLGDGESYGMAAGRVHSPIFQFDRKSREMKWWGQHLSRNDREKLIKMFNQSLYQSDVVGIPNIFRFFRDFFKQTSTSRFGLSLISQTTQRGLTIVMEQIRKDILDKKFPSSCWFVEHRNHQILLDKEGVSSFGKKANRVLIVSQYSGEQIRSIFPELSVDSIQIPSERTGNQSLPYRMEKFAQEIQSKVAPGTLALISGGFAGKYFLKVVKDAGGVALDTGAMADYWLGRKTRQVSDIV